jgi:hypothetical protein
MSLLELAAFTAPKYADTPQFTPFATPQALLTLGIFDGKYFIDDPLPADVYIAPVNYFGVSASQTRAQWQRKGWIHPQDPLGWFQWYYRFHEGRRTDDDARQIKRWQRFSTRQIVPLDGDLFSHKKRRQALLHWAHNPMPDL